MRKEGRGRDRHLSISLYMYVIQVWCHVAVGVAMGVAQQGTLICCYCPGA